MRRRNGIEGRLRHARAEPRTAFVEALAERAAGGSPRSPGWSRLAFAASLAVMMLGTFASFGGLSYAASGGTKALRTIEKVTTAHKVVVSHSSASSQYPKAKAAAAVAGKHVKRVVKAKPVTLAATKQSGTLPFTGVSLLVTVLLSLALMGGGLLLRRAERRSRS
jgi:hypothetical protein